MKKEENNKPVKEIFKELRQKLGGIDQAELAVLLKEKLKRKTFSDRSVRNYEAGIYDNEKDNRADITKVITAVRDMLSATESYPPDSRDEKDLISEIASLKINVKEIRESLLRTIEMQAETIKTLTKKD